MTFESEATASTAPQQTPAGATMQGALIDIILGSLEDSKAEETVTLEIAGKSSLADHMVIASGRSHRHVGAIADHLLRDIKEAGLGSARVEGQSSCDWVLIDTGDVIVHIFRPEVRGFYNLEKMWSAEPADNSQLIS